MNLSELRERVVQSIYKLTDMAVVKPHMVPADVFGGVTFTFFALAFLTTLLRLYTRAVVLKTVGAVGLDDYLILFGVVLPPVALSLDTSMVANGSLTIIAYHFRDRFTLLLRKSVVHPHIRDKSNRRQD